MLTKSLLIQNKVALEHEEDLVKSKKKSFLNCLTFTHYFEMSEFWKLKNINFLWKICIKTKWFTFSYCKTLLKKWRNIKMMVDISTNLLENIFLIMKMNYFDCSVTLVSDLQGFKIVTMFYEISTIVIPSNFNSFVIVFFLIVSMLRDCSRNSKFTTRYQHFLRFSLMTNHIWQKYESSS